MKKKSTAPDTSLETKLVDLRRSKNMSIDQRTRWKESPAGWMKRETKAETKTETSKDRDKSKTEPAPETETEPEIIQREAGRRITRGPGIGDIDDGQRKDGKERVFAFHFISTPSHLPPSLPTSARKSEKKTRRKSREREERKEGRNEEIREVLLVDLVRLRVASARSMKSSCGRGRERSNGAREAEGRGHGAGNRRKRKGRQGIRGEREREGERGRARGSVMLDGDNACERQQRNEVKHESSRKERAGKRKQERHAPLRLDLPINEPRRGSSAPP
ncbi:hypothetical protein C8R45DRAFT_946630 [Mycena sanguinolenta]|nr:hypothetical protein C8R45DRAFT_946630 [Mycena sanguinolenta]